MCATILDVVQSGLNWQKINRKAKEFYEDVQKDNMHILLFFIEDGMLVSIRRNTRCNSCSFVVPMQSQ